MKIALLGNMNNNSFSIMRYLRDLGADAHLFLWSNDGVGSLSHFRPECDCVDISAWSPYIHQTNLINGYNSLLLDPRKFNFPPTTSYIKSLFSGFDAIIGSGLAPAILGRAGINLDIFYPYGSGVEFVGLGVDRTLLNAKPSFRQYVFRLVRRKQIKALKKARYCLNAEMGLTAETFNNINRNFLPVPIPMVYNREGWDKFELREELKKSAELMRQSQFVIFSHASQMWIRSESFSEKEWVRASKHNDWLIQGFSKYLQETKDQNALLVLVDYGRDVDDTKKICADLNITHRVHWLPKLSRVEVMYLLGLSDLGVGEFIISEGSIWGGTGWEVLASGKPLLQTFNFSAEQFESIFGYEPPPLLDVKSPEDVTRNLLSFCKNREKYVQIGKDSKSWFDANNGTGLAKRWMDLLIAPK